MTTFILVHGTFTSSAHWPALQNALARTALDAGEHPSSEEIKWTGKNRASARHKAAFAILELVQRIHSKSVNEKIFIIGHSHGGSAIAYFLKLRGYSQVVGCIFLSTPFLRKLSAGGERIRTFGSAMRLHRR